MANSDYQLLAIIKGVGQSKGDTSSYEGRTDVIDLQNVRGFSVGVDGWVPQVAQIKGGGVGADNSLSDGRVLLGAAYGNVTETMVLSSNGAGVASRAYLQKRLRQFANDALAFHTSDYQIEPVYLAVKLYNEPGPRYALIYNIAVAQNNDALGRESVDELSITIEREPFWRGTVTPGQSPRIWTLEANGVDWDYTDLSLVNESTNHLHYESGLYQKAEPDGSGGWDTLNVIEIDGADIPGDADALVTINYESSFDATYQPYRVFVARLTTDIEGETPVVMHHAAESAGTDGTVTGDTGGVDATGNGTANRLEIDFSTDATMIRRTSAWSSDFNYATHRGRYAMFVRARQVGGSAGDINMKLVARMGDDSTDLIIESETVSPVVAGTTGNTTGWPIQYMGVMEFPPSGRTIVRPDGNGQDVLPGRLELQAERTTGAGELYLCDVISIPYHESACEVVIQSMNYPAGTGLDLVLDNTGYFLHGQPGEFAGVFNTNVNPHFNAEIRGVIPTLKPGVKNWLHFFTIGAYSGSDDYSDPANDFTVRVNIVPRWAGVRDV